MASPDCVEVLARSDADFAIIDCEHGSFGFDSMVNMLRAADAGGLPALVRVPDHNQSFIMRVLDAGALGVVIPNLANCDQARAVASAARYPTGANRGSRGACPNTRASWHGTVDWKQFVEWSNANVRVWGIVETLTGVRNIEDILLSGCLDAIIVGAFDLAQEIGVAGDVLNPKVTELLDHVVDRAQVHQVPVMATLFASSPEDFSREVERWFKRGVRMFNIGSDKSLISHAIRTHAGMVRRSVA